VLLPFLLEDHRVSSLFLESISLGNFGALVAFWGIIRSRMEGRPYFWSIVAGIILIVLSDNRFNASFLPIGVVFLFASPRLTKPVVMVLPFVAILGLCLIAANAEPQEVPGLDGGSLWDRLVYSGRILLDLDSPNWLGIWPLPPYTLDAGYAYIISTVGLIGLVACWLWFTSLTGPSRYFYAFRNTIAAYFAVLLCISQSLFTIKTAALLWFLLGVLSVAKDVAPRVVPTRHRT
jgi:putative polymerase